MCWTVRNVVITPVGGIQIKDLIQTAERRALTCPLSLTAEKQELREEPVTLDQVRSSPGWKMTHLGVSTISVCVIALLI